MYNEDNNETQKKDTHQVLPPSSVCCKASSLQRFHETVSRGKKTAKTRYRCLVLVPCVDFIKYIYDNPVSFAHRLIPCSWLCSLDAFCIVALMYCKFNKGEKTSMQYVRLRVTTLHVGVTGGTGGCCKVNDVWPVRGNIIELKGKKGSFTIKVLLCLNL